MPQVAAQKLAVAVDAFCESIGFTLVQTERTFKAAKKLGLAVKLHAEQLSDLQGTALAARYGALSADHLEYVSEEGVKAMADSGTVAVLLPGAFYFLRETRVPPLDLLRRYSVPMALSTDCNPGSSPTVSLLLMLNMACTLFRLTPEEALAGVTRNGAKALGLQDQIGTLEKGKDADFVNWDIPEPAELAYRIGSNPLKNVVRKGIVLGSHLNY
jgi:imidazolonepropionase